MRISDWSSDVCSSDLVELGDVLEHEHPLPDLVGQLRIVLLEGLEDEALGAAVGAVEDVDERLHAADHRHLRRLQDGRQLALEHLLDVLEDRKSTRLNSSH